MILSKKNMLIALVALLVLIGAFFMYINLAFPKVRCEGAHLKVPDQYADCITCHTKTTAMVAKDWTDSKHGVMLVKCVVCHGEPDGKGSIPFMVKPDPMVICSRCHDPAIKVMISKYGENLDCNSCHPHHQNPQHGMAYENKIPTSKTTLE